MPQDRVVFHVDCNGFYAAVESLDAPELRQVPMAVAGDPRDRSGIILAKNELAKRYGVKTAETIYQAQRKCPLLRLVPPRHERYAEVSHCVKRLFETYTDQVESFGLDEAWMDVTGSLRYFNMTPEEMAHAVRRRVKEEIGITVSVGVSFNKVFAKLGSDLKKPDAVTMITRDNFRARVWPLPAEEMIFVGHAAAERLRQHYITTIGDVARSEPSFLEQLLGKGGAMLWRYANGLDDDRVCSTGEREAVKSVGNGMTFRRDLVGWEELQAGVTVLTDEVAERMRLEGVWCCAVQVMIKNPALKTISRQMQLPSPTHLKSEIAQAAMQLLRQNWRPNAPVRALTVTAMQLTGEGRSQEQMDWCKPSGESAERFKLEKAENAVHGIRQRYGMRSIAIGYVESEELGIRQLGGHE